MNWFKKRILKKYPSTLYISLNQVKYSEIDLMSKHSKQEVVAINSSSSQNEINSFSSSPETYQV